jgi:hypothetical protein
MVDLIHPHVRNPILRHVSVRACYVEHEAQTVAIEIADATKHDVSARPGRHLYSGDGLSLLVTRICALPNSLRWAARPASFYLSQHYSTGRSVLHIFGE